MYTTPEKEPPPLRYKKDAHRRRTAPPPQQDIIERLASVQAQLEGIRLALKSVSGAGFEPARPAPGELKSHPFDHSGTQTATIEGDEDDEDDEGDEGAPPPPPPPLLRRRSSAAATPCRTRTGDLRFIRTTL